MRFDLSEDQLALRDAARDLLDDASSSAAVRAHVDGGEALDARLWSAMTEQGWPLVALPEEAGGLGLGWVEVAVLAEEIGRHTAPAPFVSTVLALAALHGSAAPAAAAWLEKIAGGEALAAVGFGGELVVDAPVADVIISVTVDGVVMHEVTEPLVRQAAMDQTRTVAWGPTTGGITLGGRELADRLLDAAATTYAAELLGLAGRMLEVSVDYAKTREQFGRPIGGFQAVKHRLADALTDVEGIRSGTWYAAWAITAGAPDASLAASAAKAWAGDAGRRVLSSALQVHGGIGFTWEHDLHFYFKRAQLDAVTFGDPAFHRSRIAGMLVDRVRAGESVFA